MPTSGFATAATIAAKTAKERTAIWLTIAPNAEAVWTKRLAPTAEYAKNAGVTFTASTAKIARICLPATNAEPAMIAMI